MSLWNRSSYLMIARLIPIVLILSAGFFWKYEKEIRLQTEKRLKTVSEQLVKSREELAEAKRQAENVTEEKRFLIQQLGERDEHIRRLLAEMIRLLSGSGSVDLGEVLVRSQAPGAWDGVQKEMRDISAQRPIAGRITPSPAALAPGEAGGLGQVQVEDRPSPVPVTAAAPMAHVAAPPANSLGGQILTVNAEHKFIVVSQGSQDGLKVDAQFDAYANGQKIGRVQVGTVYDRISTASLINGDIKRFHEGGAIRLEPAA